MQINQELLYFHGDVSPPLLLSVPELLFFMCIRNFQGFTSVDSSKRLKTSSSVDSCLWFSGKSHQHREKLDFLWFKHMDFFISESVVQRMWNPNTNVQEEYIWRCDSVLEKIVYESLSCLHHINRAHHGNFRHLQRWLPIKYNKAPTTQSPTITVTVTVTPTHTVNLPSNTNNRSAGVWTTVQIVAISSIREQKGLCTNHNKLQLVYKS